MLAAPVPPLRTHWFEPARDGKVPSRALRVPTVGSDTLYVARGRVDNDGGSLVLGKVHPEHGCAYFPHYGREVRVTEYDVLCVRPDAAAARWELAAAYADWTPGAGNGGGAALVVCDENGTAEGSGPLVVASTFVKGNRVPGGWRYPAAAGGGDGTGSFPAGGKEHVRPAEECDVLVISPTLQHTRPTAGAPTSGHTTSRNNEAVYWFQHAANGNVPRDAVAVESPGREVAQYIARGWIGGDLALGKVYPPHGVAYLALHGEQKASNYEVLCVSPSADVRWEPASEYVGTLEKPDGGGRLVCDEASGLVVASAWIDGIRVPGKWHHPLFSKSGAWFPYGQREHSFPPDRFDVLVVSARPAPQGGSVWFQEASDGAAPDYAFQIPVGRGDEVQYVALANLQDTQAFGAVLPAERTGIFPLHGEQRQSTYEVLCATPATRLTWEPSAAWTRATSRGDGARLVVADATGIVVVSRVEGDGRRLLGKWHHPLYWDGGAWFVRDGAEVCEGDGVEVLVVSPALPAYASEVLVELAAFSEGVGALAGLAGRLAAAGDESDERAAMDAVKEAVDAVAGRVQAFTARLEAHAAALGTESECIVAVQDVQRRVKERKGAERKAQLELAAARQTTFQKQMADQAEAWEKLRESQQRLEEARRRAAEERKKRDLAIGIGSIFGPIGLAVGAGIGLGVYQQDADNAEHEANERTKVIESITQSLEGTQREIEAIQRDIASADASVRKLESELRHFQSSGEELQKMLDIYADVTTLIREDERKMQDVTEGTKVWQSVCSAPAFATVNAVLGCVKASITTIQERKLVQFEFPKLIEEVTTAQLAWEDAARARAIDLGGAVDADQF
ncbi:hypothetical protein DFJ73DRAFT_966907 [Zopfochytrium polystomum]|nr:hypothetical protein DFJ73DRAFT_966907 [Zopfochytrium polystomum]